MSTISTIFCCLITFLVLSLCGCGFHLRHSFLDPHGATAFNLESRLTGHVDFFNQLAPYTKTGHPVTVVIDQLDKTVQLQQLLRPGFRQHRLNLTVGYHVLGASAICQKSRQIHLTRWLYDQDNQQLAFQQQLSELWQAMTYDAAHTLLASLGTQCFMPNSTPTLSATPVIQRPPARCD